jgi:TRAP-type mannitol/chloroaromatic compound transport system permease small subunit
VYSLENFLPVVDLHLGSHWRPNARHQVMKDPATGEWSSEQATFAGSLVRWYLWFHIVAGWVLTPLLFAGLSGLIRVE